MRAVTVKNTSELYQLAIAHFRAKNFDKALSTINDALRYGRTSSKEDINPLRLLADIHVAQGNFSPACQALDQALELLPGDSARRMEIAVHRAAVLLRAGDLARATADLDVYRISKSNNVRLLAQAGYIYTLCEFHEQARQVYEHALSLEPDNPQLIFNCAAANRAMGQLVRAEYLYDRVIALAPADWEAYKNRSDLRRQTEKSNHISGLRQLLSNTNIPQQAHVQLNCALAKELEDLGQYKESFKVLEKGCAVRRSGIRYDPMRDLAVMAEIEITYTRETMRDLCLPNDLGAGIIFVLGMPRTGTTLVDRILSAVPGIVSAGEPETFARLLSQMVLHRPQNKSANKLAFVRESAALDFGNLGRKYAQTLLDRAQQKDANLIIDKNPMNFLYVGLISAALPAAKIIHLRRDPMDTCYAIYKTLFKTAYPFSYDQRELGEYYLGYRKLMDHWRSVVTDNFYELDYEKLVENQEAESRKLLKFCGLPWDERCLEFYRSEDSGTATASAAQVRQPVYNSSVGKWKNYRKQLQPLVEVLRSGGITVE